MCVYTSLRVWCQIQKSTKTTPSPKIITQFFPITVPKLKGKSCRYPNPQQVKRTSLLSENYETVCEQKDIHHFQLLRKYRMIMQMTAALENVYDEQQKKLAFRAMSSMPFVVKTTLAPAFNSLWIRSFVISASLLTNKSSLHLKKNTKNIFL